MNIVQEKNISGKKNSNPHRGVRGYWVAVMSIHIGRKEDMDMDILREKNISGSCDVHSDLHREVRR